MEHLAAWILRLRWLIIVGFLVVTGAVGSQVPNMEIDARVKTMLPDSIQSRQNLDAIDDLFGGTDAMMLVLSAEDILDPGVLRQARTLSRSIERIRHVDRVLSLFTVKDIRADGDDMLVEPAVVGLPTTREQREALRQRLRDNELIYGNVVANDFEHTVIIAFLNSAADDDQVLKSIEAAATDVTGPAKWMLAGLPFVRTQVAKNIRGDLQSFLPLGLALMLSFLFVAFRELRGVLLPFFVVMMAIVFCLGLIPLLGWKLQLITVVLPVIMIAVANDYGIHLMARYQEENVPGDRRTPQAMARSVLQHLGTPVLMTGLTTSVGLLCLLSHVIVAAKEMGILAAAGVGYALLGSLLFIPAVLSVLPRSTSLAQASSSARSLPLLERLLRVNARIVTRFPWGVLGVALFLVAVAGLGVRHLAVDTNPVNFYPSKSSVRVSAALVNERFGGSTSIALVAKGDIKAPKVLRQIGKLQTTLDNHPNVGQTSSIVDVVQRMHRAMMNGSADPESLPTSRNAVAQYFLLYSMNGAPEDFDRMVDFPFEHALLTARINTLSTQKVASVVDDAVTKIRADPQTPFLLVGGFATILVELVEAIVRGQLWSLLFSMFAVGILVAFLFRSPIAGVVSLVPLLMATVFLFGLMGVFDIELNHITAMLSSIMIGVGIDYTIHFLWRYRCERLAGRSPCDAVQRTLTTSGRGIIFNALSVVVGFSVLLLSAFLPVQFFGFLVVVTIGACLVGALVVLPAIILLLRPRFTEPAAHGFETHSKET